MLWFVYANGLSLSVNNLKIARYKIVSQSEEGYVWTTILTVNIAIKSIKCLETRDRKEKLRLTAGVTAPL